jgi:UDP-N-acetylmuramyl pentapeptide synthase
MTFEDTVAELLKRVEPGDVVLVKGSLAVGLSVVAENLP